jgi:hypothetical protein
MELFLSRNIEHHSIFFLLVIAYMHRQGPQTVIALFVAENLRKWLEIPAI